MKIAYFDCFSGISGNMVLGALIDAGVNPFKLTRELKKLKINNYQIKISKVKRAGLAGTYVEVKVSGHSHDRRIKDINRIIDQSNLKKSIKEKAKAIFLNLAKAEAKAHGISIDKVHFHEVGAVDALVDVVGSVIGLEILGVEKIYSSAVVTGKGMVKTRHGNFPIPAPATANLLKGIPFETGNIKAELATPTGAAIISTLAVSFGAVPAMKIKAIGCGAGTMELPVPNLLRIFIGEEDAAIKGEKVTVLETNIDDMNPELFPYVIDRLIAAGAIDAFIVPCFMKKGRQGAQLMVLSKQEKVGQLTQIIFTETSTIGIRIHEIARKTLERETRTVRTKSGPVRVKVSLLNGKAVNIAPEFEDCRRLAENKRIPLKIIYDEAKRIFRI